MINYHTKHGADKPYRCYCPRCGFLGNYGKNPCHLWRCWCRKLQPRLCRCEGIGDIIKAAAWLLELAWIDMPKKCNCEARRRLYNQLMPIDRWPLRLLMPLVCWRFILKGF